MSEYDEIDLGEECDACGELILHCTCTDEPPEPDGECYRGGEYASALAEDQARIQRELK